MSLDERAMLAELSISFWNGQKIDGEATTELIAMKEAEQDAGRFVKNLLPPKFLKNLSAYRTEARKIHARYTMPWAPSTGILPGPLFMDYAREMHECIALFDAEADNRTAVYEATVIQQAKRLGKLHRLSEYVSPAEFRERFKIDYKVWPVPSSDYRVKFSDEELAVLKQNTEDEINKRLSKSVDHIRERVFETVDHFADRLRQYDLPNLTGKQRKLYDSMIDNVIDLADLIPKLNITGDPAIDKLSKDLKMKLTGYSMDSIKRNVMVRKSLVNEADKILSSMRQVYGKAA